jgi:uncharacterized membrane protein
MTVDQFILNLANVILNPLIRLMFAVALVVFLWGIVEYIRGAGSSDSREQGTRHIIWGLVGLFIMVSVYGIIELFKNTLFR